jgi:putative hydrolase of the HAD superfamily
VRAILFDYGNTLIRYGRREDAIVVGGFRDELAARGHAVDRERFRGTVASVTAELIDRATTTGREVRRTEKVERVLEALEIPVEPATVEGCIAAISRAFVEAIEPPDGLVPRLTRLRERYRLALLSNFFLADPIHDSLRKIGIDGLLDPRVVSAEIGWCKPHARAFGPALEAIGLPPEQILMVGDNLTADVAGGRACGLRTAHTLEHLEGALPYGRPEGNGAEPDVTVASLAELERLLLSA